MASADIRARFRAAKVYRGSQVIFGERTHLQEVLRSVEKARLPRARKQAEVRTLKRLIASRTAELNRLRPGWDRKFAEARDPQTHPDRLIELAAALPPDDYLMARVLTEHPQAPPILLMSFARHSYAAVRENVARHPHTPAAVLRLLAEDANEPLWFLVACNPSTPEDLRERLRARMRQTNTP